MLVLAQTESRDTGRRERSCSLTGRLKRAAWAFTTRRVRAGTCRVVLDATAPRPGDLVLARVNAIGYHSGLQLPEGRRRSLFVGDEIVVAYGNRYAPNQFEAVVPKTLGPCQLVAAGGVAGKVLSWHSSISKPATQITPLGLLTDAMGRTVNLRDFALEPTESLPDPCPPTVAVVGTSMDAGKTQTAAYLVRGLSQAGLRVGFAKVTGTGSGGDTWLLKDASAHPVLDFTDAGHASTYLVPASEVERVFVTLMAHLARARVGAIVLEIADGVLQGETAALLESHAFRRLVSGLVFAAGDAMGAIAGASWLQQRELPLLALGGILTSSPLQRRESMQVTGLPVYSRQDLAQPKTARKVLDLATRQRPGLTRVDSAAASPAASPSPIPLGYSESIAAETERASGTELQARQEALP